MTSITSYNNDKVVTGEVEYPATDPASGAFFQPDFKKNGDLKVMLDGTKDSLKLEAMKRIIGMIAKGRDASDLFPAVVKNVVSKNIEVKKLVYVYLVRYAEEQQDLALLSISTFQRALKDPNQLIRASALRVLSSIRVTMIVPIVMLAIRDSASDMSPYVRKTAAHAIPKLYSLDPDQKEELVAIIDKLLSDKAPLVVGSAAMAFSEVCPTRVSLIHKSYRKLCSLLADVDEWGQLALLNVLTVYAKSCFTDPNTETYSSDSDSDKPFYESDSDSRSHERSPRTRTLRSPTLDPDHRLLLRAAKPLLQSRNSGVVMAVAQLYCHAGPVQELPPVAKAMIRLLRAPAEVQSVVLNAIASLTVATPSLFEPFLKSFFVRTSDPTHIKLLKLEILTNLATEASAGVVLREFQTYVASGERPVAAATIHAIGRLARAMPAHTDVCLAGLLRLLAGKDEWVVCEAVVVVKRVVGGGAASARAAVARAAKLLRTDRLGGSARAAAVWLVAEHGAGHARAAAILAHLAHTFPEQDELVKLQLLSLAVKLSISQPDTLPVCQYIISLARYDASYDVRDRARLLRRFIDPQLGKQLPKYATEIFRPDKPQPTVESSFKDRCKFPVGSLSQYLGVSTAGYRALPPAPPATVGAPDREPPAAPPPPPPTTTTHDTRSRDRPRDNTNQKDKSFYSEPESSGSGSASSTSEASSSEGESSDDEEESTNEEKKPEQPKQANNYRSSNSGSSDSESDSESDDSDTASGAGDSSPGETPRKNDTRHGSINDKKAPEQSTEPSQMKTDKSNLDLLLELEEAAGGLPTMTPTCGGFLSPPAAPNAGLFAPEVEEGDGITPVGPSLAPTPGGELVSRALWGGVSAAYSWARAPHLYSSTMCTVQLHFHNHTAQEVTDVRVDKKTLTGARAIHEFAPIPVLGAGAGATAVLGVDFADTIQPIEFTIACSTGEVGVSVRPAVGELVRAVRMPRARWDHHQRRLRGMTECNKKTAKLEDEEATCRRVFETANVAPITATGDFLRFAGRMLSSQELVLLSVKIDEDSSLVTANCANMAIASMLANEVAQALAR